MTESSRRQLMERIAKMHSENGVEFLGVFALLPSPVWSAMLNHHKDGYLLFKWSPNSGKVWIRHSPPSGAELPAWSMGKKEARELWDDLIREGFEGI